MGIVVERPRLRGFLEKPGRRLLYGRRKTGKTFYARHVLRGYTYFIVRPGGSFYDPEADEEIDVGAFIRLCRALDRVVVDEFHRAPGRLFDALQAGSCPENLVFITSTLHYFRRFTEAPEAPLKGLFASRQVELLSPLELLAHPWERLPGDSREALALLTLYQEPTQVDRASLVDIILSGREFARSLVGEVLEEEDRAYTSRYDAILEAVAAGRERASEIAAYLHSRGLLEQAETGRITKYLQDMTRMGLLQRLPVWGKRRRHVYRHASPLTDIVYYLDARYGFYDLPLPPRFIEKAAWTRLPILVERFAERLLAELHGLIPVRVLEPEELDIALAEYRRLRIVGEVKLTGKTLTRQELAKIEAKLARYEDTEKILVVPSASQVAAETSLKVLDLEQMIKIAKTVHTAS
ncbi:MAG: ATP-binding protein [Crenarchaeota archaeon]|nr:ATP-binding protein [Thermoproteota archaeon]